ncbi:hypothetical protein ACFE04_007927 [Oxalis oulophora]
MGNEMGNNNSSVLQEESNSKPEAKENSKKGVDYVETQLSFSAETKNNNDKEIGLTPDEPVPAEDLDVSDCQVQEEREVHLPDGSPNIEVKSNIAEAEERKTEPLPLSETSEVGKEQEQMKDHTSVASANPEMKTIQIQSISSSEDFKEQEKLPEPNTKEERPLTIADEGSVKDNNEHEPVTEEMLEFGLTNISRENDHVSNVDTLSPLSGFADFDPESEFGSKTDDFPANDSKKLYENKKFDTENVDETRSDLIDTMEMEKVMSLSDITMICNVESQTEQEHDKPDNSLIRSTEESAKYSTPEKENPDQSAATEVYDNQGNSKSRNYVDLFDSGIDNFQNALVKNVSDEDQTDFSMDPEEESLTSDENELMPANLSVVNFKSNEEFEEHCKNSGETLVATEYGIAPSELTINGYKFVGAEPIDKNIVDDTEKKGEALAGIEINTETIEAAAEFKPKSVEQRQGHSGNYDIVSLADFGIEKTVENHIEYRNTNSMGVADANVLPILETEEPEFQECASRFSNDSNPSSLNSQIQMRKSPSFDIDLRIEESELIYQDKAAIESKSSLTDVTLGNQVARTKCGQDQLQYEAMPVEEKVITLEKSDYEKSRTPFLRCKKEKESNDIVMPQKQEINSSGKDNEAESTSANRSAEKHKRRSPLFFGTCLCCATVIN